MCRARRQLTRGGRTGGGKGWDGQGWAGREGQEGGNLNGSPPSPRVPDDLLCLYDFFFTLSTYFFSLELLKERHDQHPSGSAHYQVPGPYRMTPSPLTPPPPPHPISKCFHSHHHTHTQSNTVRTAQCHHPSSQVITYCRYQDISACALGLGQL